MRRVYETPTPNRPAVDGAKLRKLRHRAKLTQRELAELAGLRQLTVQMIENRQRVCLRSTLNMLAGALGCEAEELEKK